MRTEVPEKKILVIDDDADLRVLLERRLGKAGYAVRLADSCTTGVKAARGNPPDLILLDLGLPDGDGIEVLERLQVTRETGRVPVLVFTARNDYAALERALKAGANGFLVKTAGTDEMLGAVQGVLGN